MSISVLVMLHIAVIMASKMFSFMINGLTLGVRSANNIKAINSQSQFVRPKAYSVSHAMEHGSFHYDSVGSKCQASSRYLLLSMSVFIVFVSVCWCWHINGLRG